jgi:hypothetical protein
MAQKLLAVVVLHLWQAGTIFRNGPRDLYYAGLLQIYKDTLSHRTEISCPKVELLRRLMDDQVGPELSVGDCLRYRSTRKSYWKAKQINIVNSVGQIYINMT